MPDGSALLAIGVIWPSIVQVLVRRWIDPAAEVSRLLTIGAMPLVGYAAVNGRGLWRKRRTAPNDEATFRETLALLGISTFAALMPLGLMLFKTGHVEATLHQLAVLVTAAGMPALAVGLFLWRRMTDKQLAGLARRRWPSQWRARRHSWPASRWHGRSRWRCSRRRWWPRPRLSASPW